MKPFHQDSRTTIFNGDVLEVLKSLAKDSVDAIITDPPYCSGGRQAAGARGTISKSASSEDEAWFLGDNMGGDSYIWWMRQIAAESMRVATPGAMAFVFTDWRQWNTVTTAWETSRWTLRSAFSWDKARGGAMGSYWRSNHEWAAIFTKGKPRPLRHRSAFNTWTGAKPQNGYHPTEKPRELMEYVVGTVMPKDGVILDPFMGSGSTGVAAIGMGYKFVGVKIERQHCETSVMRLTGHEVDAPTKTEQGILFGKTEEACSDEN